VSRYHCVVLHRGVRNRLIKGLVERARRHGMAVLTNGEDVLEHSLERRDGPGFRSALHNRDTDAADGPLTINWILRAPLAHRGGGYRNIFRLGEFLVSRGHAVHFWVDPIAHLALLTDGQINAFVQRSFGPLHGHVHIGHNRIAPADVTIATNWPTAYTVAAYSPSPFNAYFIQDFEPEFYTQGTQLAHDAYNTYWLPLAQICLGQHLARRIGATSGRDAAWVDFALDDAFRMWRSPESRVGPFSVLFFARPGLKRRGFEIGVAALRLLRARHPEVRVHLFGASDEELGDVASEFGNLGVLAPEALATEMNDTHVLLSLSLSNISNVPFEGMACGCAVVEADLPAVVDMVRPGENCLLAKPEPSRVADVLERLHQDSQLRIRLAQQGMHAVRKATWENAGLQLEKHLLALCFGRVRPH
jgi:glycosyltransferase involved in cell wall biosynthesis